jgi:hypothetical protein
MISRNEDTHLDSILVLSRLKDAVKTVFRTDAWPGELLESVQDMESLFSELTGISDHSTDPEDEKETILSDGKAISPKDAAKCLADYARTVKFLRGIDAAIRELQKRFPGEVIEVLYAGCGPYATLAVPLCNRFTQEEVRFTLIDIHERSLVAVRTLVGNLGFAEFIRDYIRCDAASYNHRAEGPLHMVVSETMQKALAKEPQLAITANLAPQLTNGGIFIPQRISIDLCLGDLEKEFTLLSPGADTSRLPDPHMTRDRIALKQLLDVTMESAPALLSNLKTHGPNGTLSLPPVLVHIPELNGNTQYRPMILTTITVYESFRIGDYASGLTSPTTLHDLGFLRGGETIEFRYCLGEKPGFTYTISK